MTPTTAISTQTAATGDLATSLRSYIKLTTIQFKLFLREPTALFFILFFPVMLLVIFGFIWGNEPGSSFSSQEFGYIDMEVPALVALVIASIAFLSIPVVTATAREKKILRRYQATPLRPLVYFTADVSVYFGMALVSMILLILVAKLIFGLRFGGSWIAVFAGFTLSMLAFIAVGYVIASLASTSRVAQIVGTVLFFPMMFFSGTAMPLAIMPPSMQQIANWLPLTHVVNLLQELWFGGGWNGLAWLILLGTLVAGTAISTAVFRWE